MMMRLLLRPRCFLVTAITLLALAVTGCSTPLDLGENTQDAVGAKPEAGGGSDVGRGSGDGETNAGGQAGDAGSDGGGSEASATESDDPFDPNFCLGPPMTRTEALARFAPGTSSYRFPVHERYVWSVRERLCNTTTGCAGWTNVGWHPKDHRWVSTTWFGRGGYRREGPSYECISTNGSIKDPINTGWLQLVLNGPDLYADVLFNGYSAAMPPLQSAYRCPIGASANPVQCERFYTSPPPKEYSNYRCAPSTPYSSGPQWGREHDFTLTNHCLRGTFIGSSPVNEQTGSYLTVESVLTARFK